VGQFTLNAYRLWKVHKTRRPRKLSGDYRTAKANAMRPMPGLPPSHGKQGSKTKHPGSDHGLQLNPNKGATCNKVAAIDPFERWRYRLRRNLHERGIRDVMATRLWSMDVEPWTQTLTLERWRLHERLAQHFLICGPPADGEAQTPGGGGCGEKYVKLFLPLCTEAEARDAMLAFQWLLLRGRVRGRLVMGTEDDPQRVGYIPPPPEVVGSTPPEVAGSLVR